MHSLWKGYLPENLFAPAPQSRMDGEWDERDMVGFEKNALQWLRRHRHQFAAQLNGWRMSDTAKHHMRHGINLRIVMKSQR